MSRVRSSMILLGICVVALLIGVLRMATERATLPAGSSYSPQPDGARALYGWAEAVGAKPERLHDAFLRDDSAPTTLLVLQPETLFDDSVREAFDTVPRMGGTLIVAGDTLPWLLYLRSLNVTVEPIPNGASSARTPDGDVTLAVVSRYRLRADGATPLLVAPNGNWVALRTPYAQGSLVVLATAEPLTNAGLRDEATARFVYRELLSPTVGQGRVLAFDEVHHSFAPMATGPVSVNQLLFTTAPGRAVIYAAALIFVYVLVSARRLGPPLSVHGATATRRTMYEHVQMLANLYRRAGQLGVVRAMFSRHYARLLARGGAGSPRRVAALTATLERIDSARTEAELIAAVAAAQSEGR